MCKEHVSKVIESVTASVINIESHIRCGPIRETEKEYQIGK